MTPRPLLAFEELTPAGRGAVATLAIAGAGAAAAVAHFFRPAARRSKKPLPIDAIVFGRWSRDESRPGEELVVCRTGPEQFEVHCHGGAAAIGAIMADLSALGGSAQQGLITDSLADYQTHALAALQMAMTERTAALLLDQYRGAWNREIATLLTLDQPTEARRRIAVLRERWFLGQHLTRPFRVVLAGPPNVGKSSLINALLGYERAIVYDQPGTTRDVVSASTAFDGWPVELSDTAGLRATGDILEAAGVRRAEQHIGQADLVLWVNEANQSVDLPPFLAASAQRLCQVTNKADLTPARQPSSALFVSARTGEGLDALKQRIVDCLAPHPPAPGDAIPYLEIHLQTLDELAAKFA